ncbi:MAG: alpha/beta hydrolase [Actinobacteria bacterium]|nr:alpha/beta hydrolase [Actinomycetota bacterium]
MSVKTDNRVRLGDGSTVGYAEYGDQGGKPVMHFHGTPSSRFEADNPDLNVIAERLHVRFISPDRPGIGLSDWKPYTVANYPDMVVQLADALGLDRFAVTGLSGGGRFVAACAWKIPQRLTTAIIVSGTAPFDLPGVRETLSKQERQEYGMANKLPWLFRLFLWKFARAARKNPESIHAMFAKAADADKAVLTQPGVRRAFENMIKGAFEQGTRAAAYDWAIIARPWGFSLREIKMPVHIWHGEADTLVSVEHARILAEAIPDARPRFFPNEGHLLIVSHFEELLEVAAA